MSIDLAVMSRKHGIPVEVLESLISGDGRSQIPVNVSEASDCWKRASDGAEKEKALAVLAAFLDQQLDSIKKLEDARFLWKNAPPDSEQRARALGKWKEFSKKEIAAPCANLIKALGVFNRTPPDSEERRTAFGKVMTFVTESSQAAMMFARIAEMEDAAEERAWALGVYLRLERKGPSLKEFYASPLLNGKERILVLEKMLADSSLSTLQDYWKNAPDDPGQKDAIFGAWRRKFRREIALADTFDKFQSIFSKAPPTSPEEYAALQTGISLAKEFLQIYDLFQYMKHRPNLPMLPEHFAKWRQLTAEALRQASTAEDVYFVLRKSPPGTEERRSVLLKLADFYRR